MAGTFQARQTPTFLALIVDTEYTGETGSGSGSGDGSGSGEDFILVRQSDISEIKYTVFKVSSGYGSSSSPVAGHNDVTIDKNIAIQEEMITGDNNWTNESYPGYNFKFTPDSTINKAFPTPGHYVIHFEITMVMGNPICWSEHLTFV